MKCSFPVEGNQCRIYHVQPKNRPTWAFFSVDSLWEIDCFVCFDMLDGVRAIVILHQSLYKNCVTLTLEGNFVHTYNHFLACCFF